MLQHNTTALCGGAIPTKHGVFVEIMSWLEEIKMPFATLDSHRVLGKSVPVELLPLSLTCTPAKPACEQEVVSALTLTRGKGGVPSATRDPGNVAVDWEET